MPQRRDYQPSFADVPPTWDGQWGVLREFVRRWHGVSLGPVRKGSPLVEQVESKFGLTLPPSVREWVSFSEELLAQNAFGILRDCYKVDRLKSHAAVSLMLQGEGDVYWAVKLEDFDVEDPPVNTYYLDYDNNEFVHGGLNAPNVPSFVLGHLAYYLHGRGGGFLVRCEPTEAFVSEMRRAFPIAVQFGHLQVFEAENIIAIIMPPQFGIEDHHLLVEVYRPLPMTQIPDCVLAYTKNSGAFHGAFAPTFNRP